MKTATVTDQEQFDAVVESIVSDFNEIEMGRYLEGEQRRAEELHAGYFARQAGPSGEAWAQNKPSTVKRKGHAQILRGIPSQGFELYQSLTTMMATYAIRYEIDTWPRLAEMVYGTSRPFAAGHNDGDWAPRIPQREHVGFTGQHVDGLVERFADHLVAELMR